MAADRNGFSLERIADALAGAGAVAARSRDDGEIITAHLIHLLDLLETNCAIFYASESFALESLHPLRVHSSSKRELSAPATVPPLTETFIRNSAQQLVTSEDPIFTMSHLRNLGLTNAAASIWCAVEAHDFCFGTIAMLHESPRQFTQVERQTVRTFAMQLAISLESLKAAKYGGARVSPDDSSTDLVRNFENAKIGFVSRDLINPLTAILGYVELLKAENLDERSKHYVEKLQAQVEKTQNLVMSLQAVAPAHLPASPASAVPSLSPVAPTIQIVPSAPQPALRSKIAEPRPRVLLVQRNEAVIEFEKAVLSGMTVEVLTSLTGTDAVALLQAEDVHAVVLDDELDGEWPGKKLFCWIMDNKPELSERILLTVSARPKAEIRELIDKSSIAYVSKPLQMGALIHGLHQILGHNSTTGSESKLLH